jgi:hypothetical protein
MVKYIPGMKIHYLGMRLLYLSDHKYTRKLVY